MPMIGSDCGFVVRKRLRPFEVFQQNDVSNQKGWARASHHRHRSYFYKQDIDVSSRGGCVISVLTCLWAYQNNRLKITTMVTTANGSDSSTYWDSKPSSTGALNIWYINQLPFRLSEKRSSLFKTDLSTQFYPRVSHRQLHLQCPELRGHAVLLSGQVSQVWCTNYVYLSWLFYQSNGKRQDGTSALMQPPHQQQTPARDGWKDIWITTWVLHQPWLRRPFVTTLQSPTLTKLLARKS